MENQDSNIIIHSPFTGDLVNLSTVPDPAFSGKLLGDGVAFVPRKPRVLAPNDGIVKSVFNTAHAMVFETDSGIRVFLHIGINTMRLNGKGFKALVKTGDHVHQGDPLWELNLRYLNRHATSLCSPVILPALSSRQQIKMIADFDTEISAGAELFAIVPLEDNEKQ